MHAIRHQLLQPAILLAQLAKLTHFDRAQAGVLLPPDVKRRLGNAELAAHVLRRCSLLGQLQRVADLLIGKSRALHSFLLLLFADHETSLVHV